MWWGMLHEEILGKSRTAGEMEPDCLRSVLRQRFLTFWGGGGQVEDPPFHRDLYLSSHKSYTCIQLMKQNSTLLSGELSNESH